MCIYDSNPMKTGNMCMKYSAVPRQNRTNHRKQVVDLMKIRKWA